MDELEGAMSIQSTNAVQALCRGPRNDNNATDDSGRPAPAKRPRSLSPARAPPLPRRVDLRTKVVASAKGQVDDVGGLVAPAPGRDRESPLKRVKREPSSAKSGLFIPPTRAKPAKVRREWCAEEQPSDGGDVLVGARSCARPLGARHMHSVTSDIEKSTTHVAVAEVDLRESSSVGSAPEAWLLDQNVSARTGMLVTVAGSHGAGTDGGWHGGMYEGAHAVVLSVLAAGAGNLIASTARVRMLTPLVDVDTYVVPVTYLQPVPPDDVAQEALIIHGEHRGQPARLREELEGGRWFVSAAYDHFEIDGKALVRVLPIGT